MKMLTAILLVLIAYSPIVTAAKWHERHYQEAWCNARPGLIAVEYRLADKTRVDCLFEDYALEVDWGYKWAEAIGQSLYYSIRTNKRPAVLLIVGPYDNRFLKRLNAVAEKHGITVFTMEKRQ